MPDEFTVDAKHLATLARLMFQGYAGDFAHSAPNPEPIYPDLAYVSSLNESERAAFLKTADMHHVLVRSLLVLQKAAARQGYSPFSKWCADALNTEQARVRNALELLEPICNALQAAGCAVVVIKSLDHLPDLGSDLDLYTGGDEQTVIRIMREQFHASLEPRSWGDRLANKWNFAIPRLPELVEIHVRYLGQTGEHSAITKRLLARSHTRQVNGHNFPSAAPEERIVISTLQRMYRHFYFRLCDMADSASLLRSNALDFVELRRSAELGGIWPGVATYLVLVAEFASRFGVSIELPATIISSAYSRDTRVFLRGNFLRVPMRPAAELYGSQLFQAGTRGDMRAVLRLPLLPPLALTALLAYRVTGSDKGIW